jgi:hypothetical protein
MKVERRIIKSDYVIEMNQDEFNLIVEGLERAIDFYNYNSRMRNRFLGKGEIAICEEYRDLIGRLKNFGGGL